MKKLLAQAEYAFSIASLLLYSGGPLTLILAGGANEGEVEQGSESVDNSLILLLFFVNYIVTFILLLLRWKKSVYLLSKDRIIWLLIALTILSIIWSSNPPKTIARCVAIVGTSLFGLYLASRYTMKEQLKLFAWVFGVAIVLSFAFALPKYGIMGGVHAGKWRGIYYHKNVLGKEMSVSTVIFLVQAINPQKKQWLFWLGLLFSVLLVILSTATSSLINIIFLFVAFAAFQILRWDFERLIPAFTALVTIGGSLYLLITTNAEALLGSIGKDTTLTGRSELWPLVIQAISKKPWLGYGYGGFWYGWKSESSVVWYAAGWPAPNSHNGFLDIFLQIGVVGFVVFAIAFVSALFRAFTRLRRTKGSEALWPLLFLTYLILNNLGETSLIVQNDIFWVLFISIYFALLLPPEDEAKYLLQI